MVEVDAIRDSLLTQLQTITGLRASKYPPAQINLPMAYVGKAVETFHDDFEGGSTVQIEVVLLAYPLQQGIVKGFGALAAYLAKTGASSIYAAIEAGAGLAVKSCENGAIEYSGIEYIGAIYQVEVLT